MPWYADYDQLSYAPDTVEYIDFSQTSIQTQLNRLHKPQWRHDQDASRRASIEYEMGRARDALDGTDEELLMYAQLLVLAFSIPR